MNDRRWDKVEDLFLRALDLPIDEREAFVASDFPVASATGLLVWIFSIGMAVFLSHRNP